MPSLTELPSTSGRCLLPHAQPKQAWSGRFAARNRRRHTIRVIAIAEEAAAGISATASTAHPPAQLALKEWAPTCAALAQGDQTILLRKGGIREPTFVPASCEILLFPTAFHTEAQLLKPAARSKYAREVQFDPRSQHLLTFPVFARVTGAWTTMDPAVLEALDELHVWTPAFLVSRLRWRAKQPITVLELRAYTLSSPPQVPAREDMWGCFSWVDLGLPPMSEQQAHAAGRPALDDAAFAARQAQARQALAQLLDLQELQLP